MASGTDGGSEPRRDADERRYAELKDRYEAVARENAELRRLLGARRRAAVYEEKDYSWMGD